MSKSARVVLVVDDEPLILTSTALRLRRAGYEVSEASNAPEAIARLEHSTDVSVILSDYNMPLMSGSDFARIALQRWPHIALVITSGVVREPSVLLGQGIFLAKPYKDATPILVIRDLITKRAAARPN